MVVTQGFEPRTFRLSIERSTAELCHHVTLIAQPVQHHSYQTGHALYHFVRSGHEPDDQALRPRSALRRTDILPNDQFRNGSICICCMDFLERAIGFEPTTSTLAR